MVAQAARNHLPGDGIQHLSTGVLVHLDDDGDTAFVRANLLASVETVPVWSSSAPVELYRTPAA